MINTQDRSGYIGASDTKYVVGNWETKTFTKWWMQKIGIDNTHIKTKQTEAGNNYEAKIIDVLNIPNIERDKQIIKGRIRVNLDANTFDTNHEIKTYQYEKGFDINKHKDYIQQTQVQMYISGLHKTILHAYGLIEKEYDNYLSEIDLNRLSHIEIPYDEEWIMNEYVDKANYLSYCIINGKYPIKEDFDKWLKEDKYDIRNDIY